MYYTEYYVNVIYIADLEGKKIGGLIARPAIRSLTVLGEFEYTHVELITQFCFTFWGNIKENIFRGQNWLIEIKR